jgi:hypothetical protein
MSLAHVSRSLGIRPLYPFARRIGFQPDLSLHDRVDAVGSNHEICVNDRAMREGQLHATICFPDLRQAVTKVERSVWLRVAACCDAVGKARG